MSVFKSRFALLAIVPVVLAAAQKKEDPKPGVPGDGEWKVERIESEGQQSPDEFIKGATFTLKEGKYTFKLSGQSEEGKIKFDAAKNPKTVDLEITSGMDMGKQQLGIYTLEGDTFKLCVTEAGSKTRPKELVAKPGDGQIVFTFKKEKK